jgi:SAM-dependent methyltransferase
MKCRHCSHPLALSLVELGSAPASNAYLTRETLRAPEKWFPLRVLVCERCWLVQTEDFAQPEELFDAQYAYFSGYSSSWLAHAQRYVDAMTARFALGSRSHVIEVAANDGYLLQYVQAREIPCLGVEPTVSTAAAARAKGITIVEEFFGVRLARELLEQSKQADLMVANNVLAHVPDINDFVAGFSLLLKRDGVATFEFPHLLNLLALNQFDTIYHEHYSYLSLTAVATIFAANGLTVFDVEQLPTHGGSLRVFAQRVGTGKRERSAAVSELLQRESSAGIATAECYAGFQAKADLAKDDFVEFLLDAKRSERSVVAYGAAAKGNTLLNYAGVRPDLISFVVDRNPTKQGKYMPGSRIPILDEQHLREARPDYIVLLPWNLKDELVTQLEYVRAWGGRFVTAIPQLELI